MSEPKTASGAMEAVLLAVTPPPPPQLFHVLMEDDISGGKSTKPKRRLILDRRLKSDYLSRRFRAFQEAQLITPSEDDDFWCGATALERSLAACCCGGGATASEDGTAEEPNTVGDEHDNFPGALARDKIVTFVGLLALHCHSVASRALALAILERTQEADEIDSEDWEHENARLQAENLEISESSSYSSDEPLSKKRRRSAGDADESEYSEDDEGEKESPSEATVVVHSMSPSIVRIQRKMQPSRLALFLKAGGLPILSRWLMESATPVPASHLTKMASTCKAPAVKARPLKRPSLTDSDGAAAANAKDEVVASPTGSLLLPLLLFLQKLPFDLQAIRQSRINKKIKSLRKSLDAILPPPAPPEQESAASPGSKEPTTVALPITDTRTDPVAGGLQVAAVQKAVNDIMKIWMEQEAKAKEESSKRSATEVKEVADPFAAFKSVLESRLQDLNKHETTMDTEESGMTEKLPRWLTDVLAAQKHKQAATRNSLNGSNKNQTTEERARREREKERENERFMKNKEDLENAQRERAELLRKLRALKQNDSGSAAAARQRYVAPTRRGVRWKDGLGSSSQMRKREILEEVFVFVKDKDVGTFSSAADGEQDGYDAGSAASEDGLGETSQEASNDADSPYGGKTNDPNVESSGPS